MVQLKARAVFWSSTGEKSSTPRVRTRAAMASKSCGAAMPAVAKAQAVFARCCGSKSRTIRGVAVAMAPRSAALLSSKHPLVAKAQAMFESPWAENSEMREETSAAMASKRGGALSPTVAKAHAEFASSCALKPLRLRGSVMEAAMARAMAGSRCASVAKAQAALLGDEFVAAVEKASQLEKGSPGCWAVAKAARDKTSKSRGPFRTWRP
mmetsp:Transcript_17850/g.60274  ORF Transcript_17850/g.60274 Transcript_17850/m.60274 type:complete len:210 (-) Transcript_17850:1021-1650(-)